MKKQVIFHFQSLLTPPVANPAIRQGSLALIFLGPQQLQAFYSEMLIGRLDISSN